MVFMPYKLHALLSTLAHSNALCRVTEIGGNQQQQDAAGGGQVGIYCLHFFPARLI